MRQNQTLRWSHRRGVALAEALIAILILWVAVLGIGYTVTAGEQHMQHTETALRALQLAEDLMQEITSKSYAEPGITLLGVDLGETARSDFDDVDDYHNYAEPAGELEDCLGNPYDIADAGMQRDVTVTLTTQTVTPLGITIPCKVITVRVTAGDGTATRLIRYMAEPAS